jgi:hypothetical protein
MSPEKCDPTPKYYCTTVECLQASDTVTVVRDWYKGARDGGAQKWRLGYMKEYDYNNGFWQQYWSTGAGGWNTNIGFGSYEWKDRNSQRPGAVRVRFKFEYYECIPQPVGSPECYTWDSGDVDHDFGF